MDLFDHEPVQDEIECEPEGPPHEEAWLDPGPVDEEEVEDMAEYRKIAHLRSDGPWLLTGTPAWVYDKTVVVECDGVDDLVVYWREPDGFLTLIERHLQGHVDYCDPEHITHIALLEPRDMERVKADRAEMSTYLGYDLGLFVSKRP